MIFSRFFFLKIIISFSLPPPNDVAEVVEGERADDGPAGSGEEGVGDPVGVVAHPRVVRHGRPLELVVDKVPLPARNSLHLRRCM